MNRILHDLIRCKCKKNVSITKNRKLTKRSEGKPFTYPSSEKITYKSFTIKYEKKLSTIAKILLNSFQNKYLYYVIDDILYSLHSNPIERDNLLAIFYSPVISLQNNFCINFFDIWINEIYITDISKKNKFVVKNCRNLESFSYITVKFLYKTKISVKKQETFW